MSDRNRKLARQKTMYEFVRVSLDQIREPDKLVTRLLARNRTCVFFVANPFKTRLNTHRRRD